ncbi:MAG: hypothetical protein IMW90_21685 [Thermogemmatispora sp.]|uniref:hypothetical protein n=1 Tax=Thermogemmatispora sp. TaxID=1968838 RepID=UPI0019D9BB44|nr:hypothetical protein [Thermogemmatispora sp.]MBE3568339.1 hypothetical protein [Thermogemmatispora sp.]
MFALYSVVSVVDVPEPLRHHIEQTLQSIMGQAPLEQRLLIHALRQCLGTATPPSPESTLAAPAGTANDRAQRLNQLREREQCKQLQQAEEGELLTACYDGRKVSGDVWNRTVAQVAWHLLLEGQ